MSKTRTCISLEPELHQELMDLASEQERSFSKQVTYLIKKGMEFKESQKEVAEIET